MTGEKANAQHCIAKMPAKEYISTFVILFNFSTAAERQEFHFGTSVMRERCTQA